LNQKEPFLFKSYERIIGIAHDVNELKNELERLSKIDPNAVNYHIKEKHIAEWLYYIGENELAKKFENVKDVNEALSLLNEGKKPVHEEILSKESTTAEQPKPESQQKPKRRGGRKKKMQ
jgi:hypothetical protein